MGEQLACRRLLNGIIEQCGTQIGSTNIDTVTFNIAFTNTPIITSTAFKEYNEVSIQCTIQTSSKTNFTYWTGVPYHWDGKAPINWIAIGY